MIFSAGSTMREIQALHPGWTHQQCLDEQERIAVAAFERYARRIRETTDTARE